MRIWSDDKIKRTDHDRTLGQASRVRCFVELTERGVIRSWLIATEKALSTRSRRLS